MNKQINKSPPSAQCHAITVPVSVPAPAGSCRPALGSCPAATCTRLQTRTSGLRRVSIAAAGKQNRGERRTFPGLLNVDADGGSLAAPPAQSLEQVGIQGGVVVGKCLEGNDAAVG